MLACRALAMVVSAGREEGCTLLDAPPPPAVTCQAELIAEGQDLSSDSGGQEQGPGATGRKSRGQEPGAESTTRRGAGPLLRASLAPKA